jgi:hypothetical protein
MVNINKANIGIDCWAGREVCSICRQPLVHPRSRVAMSRAGSGIRDQASLFLELGHIDLSTSEAHLQDFERACRRIPAGFFVRAAFAALLGVAAFLLAATFAVAASFGFDLRLDFLHWSIPIRPGTLVRGGMLGETQECRGAAGFGGGSYE